MSSEPKQSSGILQTTGSWLFLIGSLIFQYDSILEVLEGLSTHVILHVVGSLLFTIGSIFFVIQDMRQLKL